MKVEGRSGTYLLGGAIGAGGMATVHRATRLGERDASIPTHVALKRLHPHLATDASIVTRFRNEARIAERLVHPNVVRTFDVADGDPPALMMELCDGGSLLQLAFATWNRGDAVPPPIASAIVLDLLAALEAAHEARDDDGAPDPIVHRDVSPHNLLVGKDGVARLGDFGIARVRDYTTSTGSGDLKGKIAYMAPELFSGQKASVASDLYAAGVVLWELLASERLFEGEVAEILGKMLVGSRDELDLGRRGVASEVAAVVSRALSTEPKRRFESAAVMAEALRTALPPASRDEVAAWVADAALLLPGDDAVAPPSSATLITRTLPPPARRAWWPWAIGVVVASGAIAVAFSATSSGPRADAANAPTNDPSLPAVIGDVTASTAPLPTVENALPDAAVPITAPPPTAPPAGSTSRTDPRIVVSATSAPPATPGRTEVRDELTRERAAGLAVMARNTAIARCPFGTSIGAYAVSFYPDGAVIVNEAIPSATGERNECVVNQMVLALRGSFHLGGSAPMTVTVGVAGHNLDG